jgi:hypothetical protein
MPWYFYVAHFFAALFLANSIPHFVNGISGRPFVSPFGKPPGRGESSAVSNVVWAEINLVVAGLLLWFFRPVRPFEALDAVIFAIGFFLAALALANGFSRRRAIEKM